VLSWFPAVEVLERDGQLVVRADVPGLEPDQIRVELQDGQLVISGERTQEREEREEGGIYRTERSYGSFRRVIALPEGVDLDRATANFENGVLEVTMPAPARERGKRLQINDRSKQQAGQQPQQRSV
jgi:HSP20 family protein